MVNHYYGIYQVERAKTSAELRAADVQVGELAARLDRLGGTIATPVRTVRRSLRRWRLAVLPASQATGGREHI